MDATVIRSSPRRLTRSFALWLGTIVLGVVVLGWLGISRFAAWRYDRELTRAEHEIDSGDFAHARDRLAQLATRWPGLDEVQYPLGTCEAALGNVDAALSAWACVPHDSIMVPRVALDRAKLAIEHGKLSLAEAALVPLADESGDIGDQAAGLADQIDLYAGRPRAISRRIERRWGKSRDPVALLRKSWLLDTQPLPLAVVRQALDRMIAETPDDPLLWLGRSDLEIRSGDAAAADAALKRCEVLSPDDPDLWRARLARALDSSQIDDAMLAMKRIPATPADDGEVVALGARLAAIRGDRQAERKLLMERVELKPGDSKAWGRLAELVVNGEPGSTEARRKFRQREAVLDEATDVYRKLMGEVTAHDIAHFGELARTAEILDRRFEAKGWWTLRLRQDRQVREAREALDRLAKIERPTQKVVAPGRVLADLLPQSAGDPSTHNRTKLSFHVPLFRDEAEAAGLKFVYENDQSVEHRLPETMGGGLGLIDYDGDGRLDVYAVQGGRLDPDASATGTHSGDGDRLFHNEGDGTFKDVTEATGIAKFPRGFGHGVAVGDFDNDGHSDIFVTRWHSYALYRNTGNGTFADVTDQAGLGGPRGWPTSAAFADLDNDGDLDLYVCQYLKWDPRTSRPCPNPDRPGEYLYCVPRAFEAEHDRLFRNDGGTFVDVTEEAGITDIDGRGLGVVIADLDDDGLMDIYVANDMTANFLFHNVGALRFEEVGVASGTGSNAAGGYQAGMGIACGDLDGDGRLDLAVTNFYGESTTLFQNLGGNLFADRTSALGLAASSRYTLGFGTAFLDANNDGRLDLVTANGHVNDYRPAIPYAMPAQLYLGVGMGRLVESSATAGECWQVPRVGRGLALGDIDNDGRQDVLILSQAGPLAYFHNLGVKPAESHFLTLKLEGTTANRDGVGARVRVTTAGQTQVAQRFGGGSFLTASDGRLHFGLGTQGQPTTIEVRWPSGHVDRHEGLQADTLYRVVEGAPAVTTIPGSGRSD